MGGGRHPALLRVTRVTLKKFCQDNWINTKRKNPPDPLYKGEHAKLHKKYGGTLIENRVPAVICLIR